MLGKTMKTLFATAIATAVFIVGVMPATAAASETRCVGELGAVVVENLLVPNGAACTLGGTTVLGNVKVKADARLSADSATIAGDVMLAPRSIFVISDSAIGGNVVCTQCRVVNMRFMFDPTGSISTSGNVQIRGMDDGSVSIEGWAMASLEVRDSSGHFSLTENTVSGDLIFSGNVCSQSFCNISFFFNSARKIEILENAITGADGQYTLEGNFAETNLIFSRNLGPSLLTFNVAGESLQCFENQPPPAGFENAAPEVEGQCTAVTGPPPD
jgi:hypothetical protein